MLLKAFKPSKENSLSEKCIAVERGCLGRKTHVWRCGCGVSAVIPSYLVHLPHCALHIPLWPLVTYGPNAFCILQVKLRAKLLMGSAHNHPIAKAYLHF